MNIKKYARVPIVPFRNSDKVSAWEDKIKDKFGPLFGYNKDLETSSLEKVLEDILFTSFEGDEGMIFYNYLSCKYAYINFIEDKLPIDTEENESNRQSLLNEIKDLSTDSKSAICKIVNKYGIIETFEFAVPYSKMTQDYAIIMGEDNYIASDLKSLYAKAREDIETNVDYSPSLDKGIYSHLNLTAKVYIFSKMKAKLMDVTKFLTSITTGVTDNGGNFSLDINLISLLDIQEGNAYTTENINKEGYSRALFLQNLFRENDLVFIKYETLKLEETSESQKQIRGKLWDMIGLIDSTRISSTSNDLTINIVGRDLIKLLIEDQNLFIPYQFANVQKTVFGGNTSKIFNRLFATGKYQIQFVYSLRSIESSIGFILSQLTNIEILNENCSRWLKNEYGNDLTKKFKFTQEGKVVDKETIKGIWGLINYAVDEKISHYRLADSSIASPDGSVLTQISRVCQNPLVELICDTFGDKYSIIARRPPWDKESILNSVAVPIDIVNSISDELEMDTEVYSLFQYSPHGALLGGNDSLPMSYIPIVVLDEYVKLWGNKLFNAVTNYIDFGTYCQTLDQKEKNPKYTFIDDLCWIIETMAYKPFTRRGVITLVGDRRIKRGSWIWYKKTNELFYVNSVKNTLKIGSSADRITIIEVSRGMIKEYIKGRSAPNESYNKGFASSVSQINKDKENIDAKVSVGRHKISYFNLVDLSYLKESLINNLIKVNNQYTLSKSIYNEDSNSYEETESVVIKGVFDFFMKGAQFGFSYEDTESKIHNLTTIQEIINTPTNKKGVSEDGSDL